MNIDFPLRLRVLCGSNDSGPPRELAEIGRPLFQEGIAPLLAFRRHVEERGGIARQFLDAGQPVGVGIEGGLQHAQRGGRELQHLPAPVHRDGLQLGQRHHGVDQPHRQRLLGIVLAAQEPDLLGLLEADGAGHQSGAEAAVEAADPRPGLAEAGIVGGDGQIADQMQHMAAADGIARHHGHHRLGQGADLALQIQHIEIVHALLVVVAAVVAADPLIAAGTEGQVAGAGQDDDADFRVHVRR